MLLHSLCPLVAAVATNNLPNSIVQTGERHAAKAWSEQGELGRFLATCCVPLGVLDMSINCP